MVAARHIDEAPTDPESSHGEFTSHSYVDLVFGSNSPKSGFAGVHRFSVRRALNAKMDSTRIEYSHLSCNPTTNTALKPDFLQPLHKIYAMLLFREGVSRVQAAV
jgi:hypothetical protein